MEAEDLLQDRSGMGAEDEKPPSNREAFHQVQGPREEGLSPEGKEELRRPHALPRPGRQYNRRDA